MMGTTGIQIVIILAYIGVLFGISWYVKRRAADSAEAYVLAGRKLTTPLIMVSIVGLAVGGASTIGVAEQAYKVGLSAGWYTAAWGIGAIVMGLTVAKKYRRLNILRPFRNSLNGIMTAAAWWPALPARFWYSSSS